jgi:hypothetical protein
MAGTTPTPAPTAPANPPTVYTVTFNNAINRDFKERTTTDKDQAIEWARTHYPYNNTRTTITYLADEFTHDAGGKLFTLKALAHVPFNPAQQEAADQRLAHAQSFPAVEVTCRLTGRTRRGHVTERFPRLSVVFWPHIGTSTRVHNEEITYV